MHWPRDLRDWPNCDSSRRIVSGSQVWHVQESGTGPALLLIHGAGASTHTWRNLLPFLLPTHRLIAIDLPGHGFSQPPHRVREGLPYLSMALTRLCIQEAWSPIAVIGHSAGAAVGLGVALALNCKHLAINPAYRSFDGIGKWLMPSLARFVLNSPGLVGAWTALVQARTIRKILDHTGSSIDEEGQSYYLRLASDRSHVRGTLDMMQHWSFAGIEEELARLGQHSSVLLGSNDRTIRPHGTADFLSRFPAIEVEIQEGPGHLMHEEAPGPVCTWIKKHV